MCRKAETAIITGASSGLGAELARQLAARGVAVGLTARRAEALDLLANEIQSQGGRAVFATADAGDPLATCAAIRTLTETLGPIDLLIANAGVALPSPGGRFSAESLDGMVRVNLIGAAYAIDTVLPSMIERGCGQIVGISSLAAYRGLPGSVGYSASKAALTSMLEGLRAELRSKKIAVTVVHPGFIRTPMTIGSSEPQPFLMNADRAARIILKGVAARRAQISFPLPTVTLATLGRWLPTGISDQLTRLIIDS
ncbi:MAG: SDR family NAD(P)-dependent oxidoreductase [Isosphaeraceae bacterium]